jgi:hypothetical protein
MDRDRQTATLNYELSTVWETKPRTTNQMTSGLLTLILLTSTKWWAPASASKWRMGFNSAFKGLMGLEQELKCCKLDDDDADDDDKVLRKTK